MGASLAECRSMEGQEARLAHTVSSLGITGQSLDEPRRTYQ
jgi:hypothetical protein